MNDQTKRLNFVQDILRVIEANSITKKFQKGDFLIKEGETERSLYLIEKGAVRVFFMSESEEHTIRLGYDGSLINALSSFVKEEPSELYIEAIRQTKVKFISKEVLMRLVGNDEDSLRQYNKFLESMLVQQIDREIDLLISSPTERLNRVLKRSPDLFQHIPLKYIASYLRMQPETLSRIRNS